MRLDYIRSFIGVVNYKSFSLAAKYLYLSQPTISTHIKQLEAELGVQLLVRSTKDVVLSEEGLTFYPYAVQMLETENKALAHLNKEEKTLGGIITVAASSVPGNALFPGFVSYFQKDNPDIKFRLYEGDSGDVLQKVINFDVLFGIGSLQSGNEKIVCEPLFTDEIALITPNEEKYRKLEGKFPLDLLKKERFITRELGSGTKTASECMEVELGLDIAALFTAAEFESSHMVKKAVEAGAGVAFISKLAVKDSVEEEKILQFTFQGIDSTRQIYLIYNKEKVMGPRGENALKSIRKYCQTLSL